MIDITIRFPDEGPSGDPITEEEVKTWAETMLRPMASMTGIQAQIIKLEEVTTE